MLFYQSYFPSERLSPLVARYMIISDDRKHREWQQLEVTPNGLSGLGFSFRENFRYATSPDKQQEITSGNIIGIHNCSYTVSWKQPINFFVIIFKPVGLFLLLHTDMGNLRNNLVNLNLLGLKEADWITERLGKLPAHRDRITFMENWLETRFARAIYPSDITGEVARAIIERKGAVAIGELSGEFGVNRKYLERHFLLELGSTPKEFAGIVRFNYLNTLLQQHTVSWKELTYLGNFHDQSHLIKHFHRITGLTPKVFKQMADRRPEAAFVNKHNVHELILGNTTIPGAGSSIRGAIKGQMTHRASGLTS